MMRALIELEETRATESRAPCKNSPAPLPARRPDSCSASILLPAGVSGQRTTVGFVERRHREEIQERIGLLRANREAVKPGGGVARAEPGGEPAAGWLRAQRSLSPDGHRSSSLPPPAHRDVLSTPSRSPPTPAGASDLRRHLVETIQEEIVDKYSGPDVARGP